MLAPQANIMKILAEGILGGQVPWTLVLIGGASAVIVEILGLPALPFAVGLYLPLGLSTPIMVGGIIRWLVDRKRREKTEHDPGILTASGLVAGQGLVGVALAGAAAFVAWAWNGPMWFNPLEGEVESVLPMHFAPWLWERVEAFPLKWGLTDTWWEVLPAFPFALLVLWLWWMARKGPPIVIAPSDVPTSGPEGPAGPARESRSAFTGRTAYSDSIPAPVPKPGATSPAPARGRAEPAGASPTRPPEEADPERARALERLTRPVIGSHSPTQPEPPLTDAQATESDPDEDAGSLTT